jgi:hypothetical protein
MKSVCSTIHSLSEKLEPEKRKKKKEKRKKKKLIYMFSLSSRAGDELVM